MHNLLIHNLPLNFALNSDTISSQQVTGCNQLHGHMNIGGDKKIGRLVQQGCDSAMMGPELAFDVSRFRVYYQE